MQGLSKTLGTPIHEPLEVYESRFPKRLIKPLVFSCSTWVLCSHHVFGAVFLSLALLFAPAQAQAIVYPFTSDGSGSKKGAARMYQSERGQAHLPDQVDLLNPFSASLAA